MSADGYVPPKTSFFASEKDPPTRQATCKCGRTFTEPVGLPMRGYHLAPNGEPCDDPQEVDR